MRKRSFLWGILVGCVIGTALGLFFNFNWLFLNRIGKWLEQSFSNVYNNLINIASNESQNSSLPKKDTIVITTVNTPKIKEKVNENMVKTDTVFIFIDSVVESVSETGDINFDSQLGKNQVLNNTILEKNIIVAKDELLTSKRITIDNYNIFANNYDSLLTENFSKNNNEFVIEFWVSPIKYKGYRMNKNKIVLYGIYQYDSVFFMAKENNLFMNYQSQYYFLENSSDFNSFKPLKDLKVISQIKRK